VRRVYSAGNLTEAYLVLHRLTHAGIRVQVLNEHAQGGSGEIPFMQATPEVWVVEDSDFERARALVIAHESGPAHGASHFCPACGEDNPVTFEICWRCGTLLEK